MIARSRKPAQDDVEIITDCEQGDEQWHQLRLGLPTASRFATILRSGKGGEESKTRAKLLRVLAGEILTGQVAETYQNDYMRRGNAMEENAREYYARTTFATLAQVAFVRRTVRTALDSFRVGCSPDSLVEEDGVLEVKTMAPDLLIEVLDRGAGGFPLEHRAQCQGSLWVTGRKWCDLQLFFDGFPNPPRFRVMRDDAYIRDLASAVERFDFEVRAIVTKYRSAKPLHQEVA